MISKLAVGGEPCVKDEFPESKLAGNCGGEDATDLNDKFSQLTSTYSSTLQPHTRSLVNIRVCMWNKVRYGPYWHEVLGLHSVLLGFTRFYSVLFIFDSPVILGMCVHNPFSMSCTTMCLSISGVLQESHRVIVVALFLRSVQNCISMYCESLAAFPAPAPALRHGRHVHALFLRSVQNQVKMCGG
jgi:hypothetical protein